jgi:hypothetical protein
MVFLSLCKSDSLPFSACSAGKAATQQEKILFTTTAYPKSSSGAPGAPFRSMVRKAHPARLKFAQTKKTFNYSITKITKFKKFHEK